MNILEQLKDIKDFRPFDDKLVHEFLTGIIGTSEYTREQLDMILKYFNNIYVDTRPRNPTNHIDYRISHLRVWQKTYLDNQCLRPTYLNEFQMPDHVEIKIWELLSNAVIRKEYLGFPILYYVIYPTRTCYFEKNKSERHDLSLMESLDKQKFKSILFQHLYILYNLYMELISADKYFFDIIPIPETTVKYYVNDISFVFKQTYLVLLKPTTRLIRGIKIPMGDYLIHLKEYNVCCTDNFVTWFIELFNEYMVNEFPNQVGSLTGFSKVTSHVSPGQVCLISNDKMASPCVVESYDALGMCRVCSILTTQKQQLIFTRLDVNLESLTPFSIVHSGGGADAVIGKKAC